MAKKKVVRKWNDRDAATILLRLATGERCYEALDSNEDLAEYALDHMGKMKPLVDQVYKVALRLAKKV